MYLLYFVLWLVFNGNITVEICIFGVVVAAAVFAFTCKFMDYSIAKERSVYRNFFRILRYIFVLIIEIVKANLAVIHIIFTEKEEPEPVLVSFSTGLESKTARAFHANAITMTPGTITVTLEGQEYVVHCLDEDMAEGMDTSVFVEMLTEMEEKISFKK